MKILLIEDTDSKRRAIVSYLRSKGVHESDILMAKTMTDFAAQLNENVGLFIIDFKLPSLDDGRASQNGKAILEAIIKAGRQDALLLAISSYPDDFPALREYYEAHGCILADFNNKKGWQGTLDHLLVQLNKSTKFDFVFFCALQEERNPYVVHLSPNGRQTIRAGIDCFDVAIGSKKGTIVLLPHMGLVNASITAALCIDRFKPELVGMSGICGGFAKRAELGQLFVSGMAYEYQSGKWVSDGFLQEPYQVSTDHILLTELKRLVNEPGLIAQLETDFNGARPQHQQQPSIGVFTSGSAVIADVKIMAQVEKIHRKVNALDMEVFGIHRAAELASQKPVCICVKTVVDLGNKAKGDKIHAYGSFISAKFLLRAAREFFERGGI